jgi:hypothetical protein
MSRVIDRCGECRFITRISGTDVHVCGHPDDKDQFCVEDDGDIPDFCLLRRVEGYESCKRFAE